MRVGDTRVFVKCGKDNPIDITSCGAIVSGKLGVDVSQGDFCAIKDGEILKSVQIEKRYDPAVITDTPISSINSTSCAKLDENINITMFMGDSSVKAVAWKWNEDGTTASGNVLDIPITQYISGASSVIMCSVADYSSNNPGKCPAIISTTTASGYSTIMLVISIDTSMNLSIAYWNNMNLNNDNYAVQDIFKLTDNLYVTGYLQQVGSDTLILLNLTNSTISRITATSITSNVTGTQVLTYVNFPNNKFLVSDSAGNLSVVSYSNNSLSVKSTNRIPVYSGYSSATTKIIPITGTTVIACQTSGASDYTKMALATCVVTYSEIYNTIQYTAFYDYFGLGDGRALVEAFAKYGEDRILVCIRDYKESTYGDITISETSQSPITEYTTRGYAISNILEESDGLSLMIDRSKNAVKYEFYQSILEDAIALSSGKVGDTVDVIYHGYAYYPNIKPGQTIIGTKVMATAYDDNRIYVKQLY